MDAPNALLQMMLSLQTKAEAYRAAFPLGSVLDPQSPVYMRHAAKSKSRQCRNRSNRCRAWMSQARGSRRDSHQAKRRGRNAQAVKLAAQEAAEQKQRAARVKAAMDKVGQTRLPTLPFEEAYSPKAARLQHLITRFSQIGSAIHPPTARSINLPCC